MGERPGVGVAVIVLKEDKVLLGKRKGAHGDGTWAFPGGHLEFYEELSDCALRELREETGDELKAELIEKFPIAATNDFFRKEGKHYITLFMRANYISGEPKLMEPDRCLEWDWFSWDNLPKNLFIPVENYLIQENEKNRNHRRLRT